MVVDFLPYSVCCYGMPKILEIEKKAQLTLLVAVICKVNTSKERCSVHSGSSKEPPQIHAHYIYNILCINR